MCASSVPPTSENGRHHRISVVDDDVAVRESLRFLLETAGFQVCTFDSAAEFLDVAEQHRADVLIVDHNMPLLTGLELLAELRSRGIVLPVAFMTASASPELRGRAAALGAGLVLTKPLTGDELLRFVSARTN